MVAVSDLVITDHRGDVFSDQCVHRHAHAACARHRDIRSNRDGAASVQTDRTDRAQQALPCHRDGATGQVAAIDRCFQTGLGPTHVDTGIQIDAVVGDHEAADVQGAACVQQHATIGRAKAGAGIVIRIDVQAGHHITVDGQIGGTQMDQLIGQHQCLIGHRRGQQVRARYQQRRTRLDKDVGILASGVHIRTRQHRDIPTGHDNMIAHGDVAQHRDVAIR